MLHEQNKPNAQDCMICSIYNIYFMSVPNMTEGDHPDYFHFNIHMMECFAANSFYIIPLITLHLMQNCQYQS